MKNKNKNGKEKEKRVLEIRYNKLQKMIKKEKDTKKRILGIY